MTERAEQTDGRKPAKEIILPGTALSRRRVDLAAIDKLVEEGVGFGDRIILLLSDGWTEGDIDGETHWFDPRGFPRLRYHLTTESERKYTTDTPAGEHVLQPLTRYYKRFDPETRLYEFVDRTTDKVIHATSAVLTEPLISPNGWDVSIIVGSLAATHRLTEWAAAEYPEWEDPSSYWG
jgi:hypothetical protein